METTISADKKDIFLTGTVERVTYHNEENGFCVLRVKIKGQRDLVTVVGYAPLVNGGEYLEMKGFWHNDLNHGLQFKANSLKIMPPTSLAGVEKYLGSGLIKGIGPVYGKRLVAKFGGQVFEIIEESPERLREVEGIGAKRVQIITQGWEKQKKIKEIMLFLHSNGVGTSKAVRIYKTYGDEAISLMQENPYRLAQDIYGIGFHTADQIAQKMGIAKESLLRARAGITYVLLKEMDNGNCALPLEEVKSKAVEILEIAPEIIATAITQEIAEQRTIQDTIEEVDCLFLPHLYWAEKRSGERIRELAAGSPNWGEITTDKAIEWVEKEVGITLAVNQKKAIATALSAKLSIITGGPGVGKTTIVNSILKILAKKQVRICLAAPTGRAAKRLSESTGLEAKTLHRLLEFDPKERKFKRDVTNPLDCDLVVIDESSMVDIQLFYSLLKAIPTPAAVIFVGDVNQLPSVGPGQVLADLINSGVITVVTLNEIFRQAKTSKIIINSHQINNGQLPDLSNDLASDFFFVEAQEPEDCVRKILSIVRERIPKRWGLYSIRDVQVLCPATRGGVGTKSLNIELQKVLNPHAELKVEKFGMPFALGDKVMQISNNYDKEVYNGDIGFITQINPEEKEVLINYDDREVVYDFDELDEIVLAYACTIHKSQGSEYPVVVIPLMTQHYLMLQKNLIYTGVTRGKKLVILVGQKKALFMGIKGKQQSLLRYSKLKEWLLAFNS